MIHPITNYKEQRYSIEKNSVYFQRNLYIEKQRFYSIKQPEASRRTLQL